MRRISTMKAAVSGVVLALAGVVGSYAVGSATLDAPREPAQSSLDETEPPEVEETEALETAHRMALGKLRENARVAISPAIP